MSDRQTVTLGFAGDEAPLVKSFGRVGSASDDMSSKVSSASTRVGESAGGFDKAGEAADGAESKATGFKDTLEGTAGLMSGVGEIAKGNLFEGFTMAGQGAADLAGGLATFVIPALKNLTKATIGNIVQTVKSTATNVIHKGAMIAGAAATKVMAVAQRALNLVMRANPIGIVITVLAALVAGIVIAYKKSETFRNIVQGAMRVVVGAFKSAVAGGATIINFFKTLPGKVKGFFGGIGNVISAPFRSAFSAIKRAWNSTVGGKGFTVPDWIPGLGGKSFRIPRFHAGGIMPGAPGSEGLAMLQAGERVTTASSSGGATTLIIKSDGSAMSKLLVEVLQKAIRLQGGNVQVVLGQA